jgi:GAF domain-containing protein
MTLNDPPGIPTPAAALEQLGRLTLREHSMQSLLQAVAVLTKQVMPGQPEASVSLLINDKPRTAVSTGDLASDCDESQYGHGYGPCLHAARTGEVTQIADMRAETRWPEFVRRAAEYGALSSLSIPLPISEGVAGALNIYAREAHAFGAESRSIAVRFAPYAAVAAANMYAYEDARGMADNLQQALESRAVIDQAKGILMERFRLTADQAFQALAQVSMRSNTKVRDVAEILVRTGEFPPL